MSSGEVYILLQYFGKIVANWWWFPLLFVVWKPFLFFYKWWRIDNFIAQQRNILLEVKLPRDITKPVRAMEQVMASMHGAVYHPPDWWEEWVDGQVQLTLYFEIISVGGEQHFYVRTASSYREAVESSLYSQFPEAELVEVDDYVKYVPQNIPNKEWDLWGADYKMLKNDHFPIKTYLQFETEMEKEEEKRVDPVASLLEAMAKVKPGCQLWVQIAAEPIAVDPTTPFEKWLKEGERLRDKIARRPEEEGEDKSMIREGAEILITGKVPEEKKVEEKDILPPEMKLTPGEREQLSGIERKMSKPCFKTNIRFIWLGQRDVWFKPNFRFAFSYFNDYMTLNLNGVVPDGKTLTKIHKHWFLPVNWIRPRRHYLRCRRLFRNYVRRFTPQYPRSTTEGTFIMNIEELASLFHFPGKAAASSPGLARLESKKGGVPSGLPVEE